ncbi:unnamed protein product, partial [Polarella glacialis]
SATRCCCKSTCLLMFGCLVTFWLPFAPAVLGLLLTGRWDTTPDPFTIESFGRISPSETQQVSGATNFARPERYFPEGVKLTDEQKAQYAKEGYVILRGALPAATVEHLLTDIVDYLGHPTETAESNGWMISDALFDFYTFGPLGSIASQLMDDSVTHLVRSWHHLKKPAMVPRITIPHYDGIECEDGYPPARFPKRTKVKFYVPLYNKMAAMWMLNETSWEALLELTGNETKIRDFKEGTMPGFPYEVFGEAGWEKAGKLMTERRLEPWLDRGDVIVHSPCLLHMSAPKVGNTPMGFLGPSFGSSDSRYLGRIGNRQCDSGLDPMQDLSTAPSIDQVPNPECFPVVYPLDPARGIVKQHAKFRNGRFFDYIQGQMWSWQYVGSALKSAAFGQPEQPKKEEGQPKKEEEL